MRGVRRAVATLAALPLALAAAPPATADVPDNVVVSVPTNKYVPFVLTITEGETLDMVNADTALHDVVSVDWVDGHPKFQSDVIGAGGQVRVARVETMIPSTYAFYCTVHDTMTGLLVIEPA